MSIANISSVFSNTSGYGDLFLRVNASSDRFMLIMLCFALYIIVLLGFYIADSKRIANFATQWGILAYASVAMIPLTLILSVLKHEGVRALPPWVFILFVVFTGIGLLLDRWQAT